MTARLAFSLTTTKGAPGPALLAMPGRVDRVELTDLSSGETLLRWEGPPIEASRLARTLRRDLAKLNVAEFRAAWLTEATLAEVSIA